MVLKKPSCAFNEVGAVFLLQLYMTLQQHTLGASIYSNTHPPYKNTSLAHLKENIVLKIILFVSF